MSFNYAHEKLGTAVHTLATGTSPLQQRLVYAFIAMAPVRPRDFPEDLRDEWVALIEDATREGPGGNEGALQNTMLPMGENEARDLARRVVSLERRVDRMWDRQMPE